MHSIHTRLENHSKLGLLRKRKIITKDFLSKNSIILNNKNYINFSSNDYLVQIQVLEKQQFPQFF